VPLLLCTHLQSFFFGQTIIVLHANPSPAKWCSSLKAEAFSVRPTVWQVQLSQSWVYLGIKLILTQLDIVYCRCCFTGQKNMGTTIAVASTPCLVLLYENERRNSQIRPSTLICRTHTYNALRTSTSSTDVRLDSGFMNGR
jgi:hypothetical protein